MSKIKSLQIICLHRLLIKIAITFFAKTPAISQFCMINFESAELLRYSEIFLMRVTSNILNTKML